MADELINVRKLKDSVLLQYEALRREGNATWHDINWDEVQLISGNGDAENVLHLKITNSHPAYKELFEEQKLEPKYCDVLFVADDGYVPAHRVFLQVFSDFLDPLIKENMRVSPPTKDNPVTITLTGTTVKLVKIVLSLLYTGKTYYTANEEEDVNSLMRMLKIDHVRAKCKRSPQDQPTKKVKLIRAFRFDDNQPDNNDNKALNWTASEGSVSIVGEVPGNAGPSNKPGPSNNPGPSNKPGPSSIPTPSPSRSNEQPGGSGSTSNGILEFRKVPPGSLINKGPKERIKRPVLDEHVEEEPPQQGGSGGSAGTSSSRAEGGNQNSGDKLVDALPEFRKVPPGTLLNANKQPRIKRTLPEEETETVNQKRKSRKNKEPEPAIDGSDNENVPSPVVVARYERDNEYVPSGDEENVDEDDEEHEEVGVEELVELESDDDSDHGRRPRTRNTRKESKSRSASEEAKTRYPKRSTRGRTVFRTNSDEDEDADQGRITRKRKRRQSLPNDPAGTQSNTLNSSLFKCMECPEEYPTVIALAYHLDTVCAKYLSGMYCLETKECKTCTSFFAEYTYTELLDHVKMCVCGRRRRISSKDDKKEKSTGTSGQKERNKRSSTTSTRPVVTTPTPAQPSGSSNESNHSGGAAATSRSPAQASGSSAGNDAPVAGSSGTGSSAGKNEGCRANPSPWTSCVPTRVMVDRLDDSQIAQLLTMIQKGKPVRINRPRVDGVYAFDRPQTSRRPSSQRKKSSRKKAKRKSKTPKKKPPPSVPSEPDIILKKDISDALEHAEVIDIDVTDPMPSTSYALASALATEMARKGQGTSAKPMAKSKSKEVSPTDKLPEGDPTEKERSQDVQQDNTSTPSSETALASAPLPVEGSPSGENVPPIETATSVTETNSGNPSQQKSTRMEGASGEQINAPESNAVISTRVDPPANGNEEKRSQKPGPKSSKFQATAQNKMLLLQYANKFKNQREQEKGMKKSQQNEGGKDNHSASGSGLASELENNTLQQAAAAGGSKTSNADNSSVAKARAVEKAPLAANTSVNQTERNRAVEEHNDQENLSTLNSSPVISAVKSLSPSKTPSPPIAMINPGASVASALEKVPLSTVMGSASPPVQQTKAAETNQPAAKTKEATASVFQIPSVPFKPRARQTAIRSSPPTARAAAKNAAAIPSLPPALRPQSPQLISQSVGQLPVSNQSQSSMQESVQNRTSESPNIISSVQIPVASGNLTVVRQTTSPAQLSNIAPPTQTQGPVPVLSNNTVAHSVAPSTSTQAPNVATLPQIQTSAPIPSNASSVAPQTPAHPRPTHSPNSAAETQNPLSALMPQNNLAVSSQTPAPPNSALLTGGLDRILFSSSQQTVTQPTGIQNHNVVPSIGVSPAVTSMLNPTTSSSQSITAAFHRGTPNAATNQRLQQPQTYSRIHVVQAGREVRLQEHPPRVVNVSVAEPASQQLANAGTMPGSNSFQSQTGTVSVFNPLSSNVRSRIAERANQSSYNIPQSSVQQQQQQSMMQVGRVAPVSQQNNMQRNLSGLSTASSSTVAASVASQHLNAYHRAMPFQNTAQSRPLPTRQQYIPPQGSVLTMHQSIAHAQPRMPLSGFPPSTFNRMSSQSTTPPFMQSISQGVSQVSGNNVFPPPSSSASGLTMGTSSGTVVRLPTLQNPLARNPFTMSLQQQQQAMNHQQSVLSREIVPLEHPQYNTNRVSNVNNSMILSATQHQQIQNQNISNNNMSMNKAYGASNVSGETRGATPSKHTCPQCGLLFRTEQNLNDHQKDGLC